MNTTEYQQSKVKFVQKVFEATETSLESFSFEKNLQCPELVKMVMLNMGLDQSNVKEIDPYVRMYLKDHPSYVSSRGRNGGIMPRSKKSSKQQNKSARAAAKEEAKEIVNAIDRKSVV